MNIEFSIKEVFQNVPVGQRIPGTMLVAEVQTQHFKQGRGILTAPEVISALMQAKSQGWLSETSGRLGGWTIDPHFHPAVVAMINKPKGIAYNIIHPEWIKMFDELENCSVKPKEADCKHCSRKNDCGVKKCWNCEVSNPC